MDLFSQWQIAAQLRDLSQEHLKNSAPCYLLAYEIAALLEFIPDLRQRMLIELLFHCGGRINEVLAVTPADLALESPRPFIALRTLKQRSNRTKGRPRKDDPAKRLVPLLDVEFTQRLQHYVITFSTGRQKPLWPVTAQCVRNWLKNAVKRANENGINFSVSIRPHVFRHSYSMHLLLWGRVHIKRLQAYLGHASLASTEIYTRLLSLDAINNEPPLSFSVHRDANPLLLRDNSLKLKQGGICCPLAGRGRERVIKG